MAKLKVEYINKEKLVPYANNAKIHTDEQIGKPRKALKNLDLMTRLPFGKTTKS